MILIVTKKNLLARFVPFVPSELFTLGHIESNVYKVVPMSQLPHFLGNCLPFKLINDDSLKPKARLFRQIIH